MMQLRAEADHEQQQEIEYETHANNERVPGDGAIPPVQTERRSLDSDLNDLVDRYFGNRLDES